MALFEQRERQPFLRVPAATGAVIALLVLAHVARVMAPAGRSEEILANYAFFPARYSHAFLIAHSMNPGTLWDRAIPFVTYIFLHANVTHLAINCGFLLPFGSIVARRFGALKFFLFFLLSGIAGAVAHLVTHWGSTDYALGASAAISGLIAAGFRIIAVVDAPDMEPASASASDQPRLRRAMAPLSSPRLVLWTGLFVVLNVIAGLTGLGAGPGAQVIAWQAHIGGYLAGLILAGPFDRIEGRSPL